MCPTPTLVKYSNIAILSTFNMIKINPDDIEIAKLRSLKFSVSVKGKPEHSWSDVYQNLGLKEAFTMLQRLDDQSHQYHDKGVFVQTKSGAFKYWSTSSHDLFNSVVLLA